MFFLKHLCILNTLNIERELTFCTTKTLDTKMKDIATMAYNNVCVYV